MWFPTARLATVGADATVRGAPRLRLLGHHSIRAPGIYVTIQIVLANGRLIKEASPQKVRFSEYEGWLET